MFKKNIILFCLFILLLHSTPAQAATFTVTNNSEGTGVGSLRWALNQAEASAGSDIIDFSGDFTISPIGGTRILFFDNSVLVMNPNNFNITIDGTQMTGDPITWPRVGMRIYDSRYDGGWGRLAKNVLIQNMTVQNCTDAGFLIEKGASDITLQDCTVIGDSSLIIDGTLPSSDSLQHVTGITINNCYVENGNIIVTQSANYDSLITTLWSTTTSGIWMNEQTENLASFVSSAGNNLGSLTYNATTLTTGTTINNEGTIKTAILRGSDNIITNNGTIGILVGNYNEIASSTAGGNTITNNGNAALIVGSYNQAASSSSRGNTIINTGYVGGDIYGSINAGTDSSGGNDTITNTGTVAGSIYAADGNDKIILRNNSSVKGITDGGNGSDTLYLENIRNINNSTLTNFENAHISGIYGLSIDSKNNTLNINGNVTITDSVLDITLPRNIYSDGTSWEIIKTTNNINGEFSAISKNFTSATLNLTQSHTENAYNVTVVRKSYANFTDNHNAKAVGRALENLIPHADSFLENMITTLDFDFSESQIAETLENLSPDTYAILPDLTFATMEIFNQKAYQHQLDMRKPVSTIKAEQENSDWKLSLHLLNSNLRSKADNGIPEYRLKTDGFMIGADSTFGDISQTGLFFGYSDGKLLYEKHNNEGDIESFNGTVYFNHDFTEFFLNTNLSYTRSKTNAKRLITTPFSSTEGNINFDSDAFCFSLGLGKDISYKKTTITPLASFNYAYLHQNGFEESSNSNFALTAKGSKNDQLKTSVGLRLNHSLTKTKWNISTRGKLCWQHFLTGKPETNVYFSRYPSESFSLKSNDTIRDQLVFNIGIHATYKNIISVYTDYFLSGTDKRNSQTFSGGISLKF